jgi:hypothetical protein
MSAPPLSEAHKAGVIGERVASLEARVNGVEQEAGRLRGDLAHEVEGLGGSLSGVSDRVASLELSRKYFLGWLGGAAAIGAVGMFLFNTLFEMWKAARGH